MMYFRHFLTRFHPQYLRSLVYMAQASEYRVRDYLTWFWRTTDFRHVEQRKTLVKTPKALILLVFVSALTVLLYAFALWVLIVGTVWWRFLAALVIVLGTPFVVAYALAGFLFLLDLHQWPIEALVIKHAKKKLAAHTGIKIAVAGSFGKTSMREILKTVLGAGKRVAAPPGSYNTPLGLSSFIRGLKGDEEVLIFELGEYYPGDIRRLCALVEPDMGVITGVNEAHLEKFKDLERTRKTIFELADCLGERPLYINGESERARTAAPAHATIYSREGAEELKVTQPHSDLSGTTFVLNIGKTPIQCRSKLLGLHQVGPLAAAAHIALRLGLSTEEIQRGIGETRPFEHRLEPRQLSEGVTLLDDSYNGNPDGVRAVIEFLASLKGYRRWYVTPGLVEMGPKKAEVHREIGKQLAAAQIEKVVLIRNSVTPFIAQGLQEGGFSEELLWFNYGPDAYNALPNLTVKGDVVLLQNDWPDQYA